MPLSMTNSACCRLVCRISRLPSAVRSRPGRRADRRVFGFVYRAHAVSPRHRARVSAYAWLRLSAASDGEQDPGAGVIAAEDGVQVGGDGVGGCDDVGEVGAGVHGGAERDDELAAVALDFAVCGADAGGVGE